MSNISVWPDPNKRRVWIVRLTEGRFKIAGDIRVHAGEAYHYHPGRKAKTFGDGFDSLTACINSLRES